MKKIISVFAAVLMLLCSVTWLGCGGGSGDTNYKSRPNKMVIVYFNSGYGIDWLNDCAKYYMDNIDENTYVEVRGTVLNAEEGQKTLSGLSSADLVILQYGLHRSSGYLNDLTDIYSQKVYGEEITLKDKMEPYLVNYYNEGKNGNELFYQVPWGNMQGWSFVYNKTSLDEYFGKDNYILPRTTNELLEFGDKLADPAQYAQNSSVKDMYLTALSLYDSTDYLSYAVNGWVGNMLGYQGRDNLLNGKYFNKETNEWQLATSSDFLSETIYKDAVESIQKFENRFFNRHNGYAHSDSASMRFMDAQAALCGLGFGQNKRKVAMLYNGPWLELEMKYLLDEAESTIGKQDLRAMKLPIMSEIIKRTPSITNESQLREIIDYVDGVLDGKTLVKPSYVSDSDVEIVKESRRMVTASILSTMAVPNTAKNTQAAKDFLLFLASDIAQDLTLQATQGLSVLPFKKYTSDKVEITEFSKSFAEITNNGLIIDHANFDKAFYTATTFGILYNGLSGLPQANYFAGMLNPDELYDKMCNYYKLKWPSMLEAYEAAIR